MSAKEKGELDPDKKMDKPEETILKWQD